MQSSCLLYLRDRDLYLITLVFHLVSGTLPKSFPAPGPLCILLLRAFAACFFASGMEGFILTFGSQLFNVTLKMRLFFPLLTIVISVPSYYSLIVISLGILPVYIFCLWYVLPIWNETSKRPGALSPWLSNVPPLI